MYLLRKAGDEDGILGPCVLMHAAIQPYGCCKTLII